MNVNLENPSALRRKLTIDSNRPRSRPNSTAPTTICAATWCSRASAPATRRARCFERLFGDRVRGEIVQKLIKEYTEKALEEQNLKPLLPPEIVTEESDLAKALRFSATFDLAPRNCGARLPGPACAAAAGRGQRRRGAKDARRSARALATLKKVEDRTRVERGDLVLAEIEGHVDGKPLEGAKIRAHPWGFPERLAHGLDEVLAGAEVGHPAHATRSYGAATPRKTSPARPSSGARRSRKSTPRCCPRSTTNSPRAWATSPRSTSYAPKVHEQLMQRAREEADMRARQGPLDLVIERNPVEVPQSLDDRERELMESEMSGALVGAGMSREAAAERVRNSADEIRTRAHKRALSSLYRRRDCRAGKNRGQRRRASRARRAYSDAQRRTRARPCGRALPQ